MEELVIIQARMGSKRFPRKSMYLFNQKPNLEHLMDSLLQLFDVSAMALATSVLKDNDALVHLAHSKGIEAYRGDEHNVASRFMDILEKKETDYFIRMCGDSPLFDYRLIEDSFYLLKDKPDIISTIYTERLPSGMNFEIIKRETFLREYGNFSKPAHFEHVTPYFYENDKNFNIIQIPNVVKEPGKYNFSFDNEEDRSRLELIFNHIQKSHYYYTFADKCNIYRKLFF